MRIPAGFDTDQTRRLLFEKSQHPRATQPSVEDRKAIGVSAVDLKNLFSQIQPDGGNLLHGTAPMLWRCDNDHGLALRCCGGGPFHLITFDQATAPVWLNCI
jgi:hypothetical protein